ncbi:MAG: hypothetical protein OXF77_00890 [Thaumarchaeota archaeon]|nr:hypothetical protein [Nitrososphaerota archaeon]
MVNTNDFNKIREQAAAIEKKLEGNEVGKLAVENKFTRLLEKDEEFQTLKEKDLQSLLSKGVVELFTRLFFEYKEGIVPISPMAVVSVLKESGLIAVGKTVEENKALLGAIISDMVFGKKEGKEEFDSFFTFLWDKMVPYVKHLNYKSHYSDKLYIKSYAEYVEKDKLKRAKRSL